MIVIVFAIAGVGFAACLFTIALSVYDLWILHGPRSARRRKGGRLA